MGSRIALYKDKQLDSPRRDILRLPQIKRTECNTPNVDVSVAFLLVHRNLRDSHTEDNVRKRPFPLKFDRSTLSGYIESATKIRIIF